MTPTPSMTRKTREKRKVQAVMVGGGVVLLLLAFGLTAWALGGDDETPAPPPTVSAAPDEVSIGFIGVPSGVALEVDGNRLGSDHQYRTAPGDEVHHVRALIDGREVWRYDAIFRDDAQVTLPPLTLPTATMVEQADPEAETEPEPETEPDPIDLDDEIVEDPDAVQRPRMRTMRPTRMFVTIMRTPTRMTPTRMTPTRMTPTRMTPTRMLGMQLDLGYP